MRRNQLRELLDSGQSSVATHIHSSWPTIIELAGYSEVFDYVEQISESEELKVHFSWEGDEVLVS